MTNLALFAQAMLLRPPVVLARQLRPFSAWHALVLSAAASPYLCVRAAERTMADLVFAVHVCCGQYPDGDPPTVDEVADWGREVAKAGIAFDREDAVFAQYIDDHLTFPALLVPAKSKPSPIPVPFKVAASIMEHYGLSEAEAWNMPLNRAVAYRICIAEENGLDVMTDTMRATIERINSAGLQWKPPAGVGAN